MYEMSKINFTMYLYKNDENSIILVGKKENKRGSVPKSLYEDF